MWNFVKASFLKDYRIVLYDNIGASHSDHSYYDAEKYEDLNGYKNDLIELCDDLNLKEVTFVGHSVSGMVGILASIERPELFAGLIIIGTSPCYLNHENYKGGFEQEQLDELYKSLNFHYEQWARGFSVMVVRNEDRPAFSEGFLAGLLSLRTDIAYSLIRAIFQYDFRSVIPLVKHPVLILQSHDDNAVPAPVAEYLHAHIPGSILKYVNAEGHFPHITAPDEVVRAIMEFLPK